MFFIGGLVVGGVSALLLLARPRARARSSARVTPTVFPHGAGVTLTFGGAPMKLASLARPRIADRSPRCSIHHRSDEYACTKNTDCDTRPHCDDGFCVVAGHQIDAPTRIDGPTRRRRRRQQLPARLHDVQLAQKTCTIDCQQRELHRHGHLPRRLQVRHPVQHRQLVPQRRQLPRGRVVQRRVQRRSSRAENVAVRRGPCDVSCSGQQSCRGVSCNNSCACDVACTGNQSCSTRHQCSRSRADSGLGCTSVPALCHSCQ